MTLAHDDVRFGDFLPETSKSYAKIPQIMEMPNLIKVQLDSYAWFIREGLR
jgi:DNA-directed RNA polymerase beta subunit